MFGQRVRVNRHANGVVPSLAGVALVLAHCGSRSMVDSEGAIQSGDSSSRGGRMGAGGTIAAVVAGRSGSPGQATTGAVGSAGTARTGGGGGPGQRALVGNGGSSPGRSSPAGGGGAAQEPAAAAGWGGSAGVGAQQPSDCPLAPRRDERSDSCGLLIDDMEDGTGVICSGGGRKGVWYAFRDPDATQWPPLTNPGTPIPTSCIPGRRGASNRAIHTYGQHLEGDRVRRWGAGVGLDLAFDGTTYRTYDARAYDGITFWARSDTPAAALQVRVSTSRTTIAEYGGVCPNEPCDPRKVELHLGLQWEQYWVSFDLLGVANADRGELTNIQFIIENDAEPPLSTVSFDFWIDDISYYAGRPACCESAPEACAGPLKFTDKLLEDTLRRTLAKPTAELRCEDVCTLQSLRLAVTGEGGGGDLGGIECLTGLTALSVHNYGLTNLQALSGLRRLRSLDVTRNRLTSLAFAPVLEGVARLGISQNYVTDLSPLSSFRSLAVLLADHNMVETAHLGGQGTLAYIGLSNNVMTDVSVTSEPQLLELDLSNNRIHALELSGLSSLVLLDLANNRLEDLSGLMSVQALQILRLGANPLSDLGLLTNATQLNVLSLDTNPIKDLGPLVANPGLGSGDLIYIDSGSIDCKAQAANIAALRDRGVRLAPAYGGLAPAPPPFCP